MDFFALPDAFHREVLKLVEIKDRLRLRLTCRAFEKLVSETNAGYFEKGEITRRNDSFSISFGDLKISVTNQSQEGLGRLIHLRQRLFNKVSLLHIVFNFDCDNSALDFILKFTEQFEFDQIKFVVVSEDELDCAIRIMAAFTSSKVSMQLWYLPDTDTLLSLNRVDDMLIVDDEISRELFFKLLPNHKELNLGCKAIMISSKEWRRAMQAISDDTRDREVRLTMKIATIVKHLHGFGISERSNPDDRCNEFEVCLTPENDECLQFRYKHCWINCLGDVWTSSDVIATVIMTNHENYSVRTYFH